MLVSFFLRYWKLLVVVAVLAGGYFYWQHLEHTIIEQRVEIAGLKSQLDTCLKQQDVLAKQLTDINTTVTKWNESYKAVNNSMTALQGRIDSQNAKITAGVSSILTGYKPKTCDEAIKYLIDAGKDVKWAK